MVAIRSKFAALSIGVGVFAASAALAAPLPKRVGQCAGTRVAEIMARLQDGENGPPIPDSGSAVSFVNGGYQVSYDIVPAIRQSKAGDPVRVCLVSIPHPCPPGDARGRIYKTTNLRTGRSWELPDSEHSCGGA